MLLQVDPEANLIVCGEELCAVSPDGRVLGSRPTPEGRPAACALGDALYVSTTEGYLYRVGSTPR
jgi:sugar lactone lactonase YvrE